jgi:FlaA1/EpsC-like NDP-sugar epimerase
MKYQLEKFGGRLVALVHDLIWIPVAWMGAFWLRFNLETIPELTFDKALAALAIVVPVQILVLWWSGVYKGVWRFISMPDFMRLVKGLTLGLVLIMGGLFAATRLDLIPRSCF